jgi:hypothetical protein
MMDKQWYLEQPEMQRKGSGFLTCFKGLLMTTQDVFVSPGFELWVDTRGFFV